MNCAKITGIDQSALNVDFNSVNFESSVWGVMWIPPSKRIIARCTLIHEVAALSIDAVARLMSISSVVLLYVLGRPVGCMVYH